MERAAGRDLTLADDAILAGRAADGDVRAFETLVRRHGGVLRAYATRILGSSDEVDDVVQESFITAWAKLPALTDLGSVRNWLLTIVTRKALDRVRARKRHPLENIDDHVRDLSTPGPASVVEASSREEALSAALAALPEDQRQSWMLREVAQYSYDGIAERLGLPVSTVRGLLARSRKTLVRELEVWR